MTMDRSSLEQQKRLVHKFIDLSWNQARLQLANYLLAKDFVYQVSLHDHPLDYAQMVELVQNIRAAMDDFSITVETMLAEGNQVVSQSTFSGTIRRPLFGFAPSDKLVALTAVTFWQLKRGVIQSAHTIIDTADLHHQYQRIQAVS